MVERKIVWSHRANIRLYAILEFYTERNGSNAYSAKLYRKFNQELRLLLKQPDIGVTTTMEDIRGLIVDDFILYYETAEQFIIVHTVWDTRQDPDALVIK